LIHHAWLMPDVDRLASGKWQARWRDDTGRQRKASFPTKSRALAHLAEVATDLRRGSYIDERAGRMPLADYARQWVDNRPYRAQSRVRMLSHLAHLEDTALGRLQLGQVRSSHIQAWATDRARVLAPATMGHLLSFLRSVLASAAEDRLIARSPVPAKIALPRPPAVDRIIPVTVAQVRAIADWMPARARALVYTQAGVGPRVQELVALRRQDVDFLRREVHVAEQLHPRRRTREPLKTPGSDRTIPLPTMVAEILAQHLERYGTGPGGELFTMDSGRLWQYDRLRTLYEEAVAAAGLPAQDGTHFLRHHYASVLLQAGESVVTVAARLGHTTPALVLSTYAHLMPDSEDRTRRAIDDAWGSASDVPRDDATGG
jgi:integrase